MGDALANGDEPRRIALAMRARLDRIEELLSDEVLHYATRPRGTAPVRVAGVGDPLNLPFDPIERAHDNWTRRWGASPAMAAVTSLMRAQQILIGQLDNALKPYELTFARYEALVLLTFSATGSLPLGKIGERLMVHPTSVTNTIDRLERQGLVRRLPNPRDGRGTLAEITDAGREVVEEATRDLLAMDFGLDCYDDDELWGIHRMLGTLRVSFGDFPGEE